MVVSEGHFAFLVISNSPDTVWVSKIWTRSAVIHRQHQYWCGQASLYHSVGSAYEVPPSCLISGAARCWVALEVFGSYLDSTSLLSCGYMLISVCPRALTWDSSCLPVCCGTEWLHFLCVAGFLSYKGNVLWVCVHIGMAASVFCCW